MNKYNIVGILKNESQNAHLDHLVPLCSLLDGSLLVTDTVLYNLATKYYPDVEVKLVDHWDVEPFSLTGKYDLVIHSFFWNEDFLPLINKNKEKPLRALFTPHGNSDKGHHSVLMERYAFQDITLYYGNHMKDFLSYKKALDKLRYPIEMGNIRYRYYQKNKACFDSLVEQEVLSKFSEKRPIALYAPTWSDGEDSTSFFHALDVVCSQLPSSYNLVVKLHPYLLSQQIGKVLPLVGKYENDPRINILMEFPPIYPLLDKIDLYLGDFSSVGYDFLAFNRPMIFFNVTDRPQEDKSCSLHRCGTLVSLDEKVDLLDEIDKALLQEDIYSTRRKETYAYTFSPADDDKIKNHVLSLIE